MHVWRLSVLNPFMLYLEPQSIFRPRPQLSWIPRHNWPQLRMHGYIDGHAIKTAPHTQNARGGWKICVDWMSEPKINSEPHRYSPFTHHHPSCIRACHWQRHPPIIQDSRTRNWRTLRGGKQFAIFLFDRKYSPTYKCNTHDLQQNLKLQSKYCNFCMESLKCFTCLIRFLSLYCITNLFIIYF